MVNINVFIKSLKIIGELYRIEKIYFGGTRCVASTSKNFLLWELGMQSS